MIRLRLLGQVDLDGTSAEARGLMAQPRRLALLAYLALRRPRGYVRRDALLPLFWPEVDQVRARKALRQAVYMLRQSLGSDAIQSRGSEDVALDVEELWCDVIAFEEGVAEGRLEQALAAYRGELMPGFHLPGASDFMDWLDRERRRLSRRALGACESLVAAAEASGAWSEAVRWARRSIELAPDDEAGAARAVRLLARTGDRTGALRLLQDFGDRLEREYDLTPSADLEALGTEIREGRIEPVTRGALEAEPPRPDTSSRHETNPGTPRSRRTAQWIAAAAAVGSGLALWATLTLAPVADAPGPETVLAIFPFTVQGDDTYAYLAEGMVDLLSTSLNGAGVLRTVDPATLMAALEPGEAVDVTRARALLPRLEADAFVLGAVVEAGGRVRISARIYGRDGAVLGHAEGHADTEADLFDQVDLVARRLLAERLGDAASHLSGVAARTTESLAALKAYLAAERAFRTDRHAIAVTQASAAVALDSTFALAHYRLSTAAAWTSQSRLARDAARDALEGAHVLGPRDRALIAAHLDQQERRWDPARSQLQAVLAAQPDHLEAWFKLGEILFHSNPILGRPIGEAEDPFRRTLSLDPDHVAAALHLGRLAAAASDAPLLDSMLSLVRDAGTGGEAELELLALRGSVRPETEADVIDAFIGGRPAAEMNAAVWSRAVFAGDLAGAARLARLALATVPSPEWQAVLRSRLAYFALSRGRWREAWSQISDAEAYDSLTGIEEKGWFVTLPFLPAMPEPLAAVTRRLETLAPPARPATLPGGRGTYSDVHEHMRLYLLGLARARAGDPGGARAAAAELATLPAPDWPEGLLDAWGAGVEAAALVAEGRNAEAFRLLDRDGRGPRGLANAPAFTESVERFVWATLGSRMPDWRGGPSDFDAYRHRRIYHLAYLGPADWQRARVLADRGRTAEARSAYRRFLSLWRDCEPPLCKLRDEAAEELARIGPEERPGRP